MGVAFCSACGSANRDDARFCARCGQSSDTTAKKGPSAKAVTTDVAPEPTPKEAAPVVVANRTALILAALGVFAIAIGALVGLAITSDGEESADDLSPTTSATVVSTTVGPTVPTTVPVPTTALPPPPSAPTTTVEIVQSSVSSETSDGDAVAAPVLATAEAIYAAASNGDIDALSSLVGPGFEFTHQGETDPGDTPAQRWRDQVDTGHDPLGNMARLLESSPRYVTEFADPFYIWPSDTDFEHSDERFHVLITVDGVWRAFAPFCCDA